jgi:hypothetical protein
VLQITFAFALDVAYADGGASSAITLGASFDFTTADRHVLALNAATDRWDELTVVLGLRHDGIQSCRASQAGDLAVEFESGARIAAATHGKYESWAVSGPGFQLIAVPGGGVTAFADPGSDAASPDTR